MQAYADKALAIKPNDAQANFAEGIALTGQWTASHNDDMKKSAAAALDKADQQAKAEGNEALSLQIETFVKKYLNATPASGVGRRRLKLSRTLDEGRPMGRPHGAGDRPQQRLVEGS